MSKFDANRNLTSSLKHRIFLLKNGTSKNPTGTPQQKLPVYRNKNKNKNVRKMIPAAEIVSKGSNLSSEYYHQKTHPTKKVTLSYKK